MFTLLVELKKKKETIIQDMNKLKTDIEEMESFITKEAVTHFIAEYYIMSGELKSINEVIALIENKILTNA